MVAGRKKIPFSKKYFSKDDESLKRKAKDVRCLPCWSFSPICSRLRDWKKYENYLMGQDEVSLWEHRWSPTFTGQVGSCFQDLLLQYLPRAGVRAAGLGGAWKGLHRSMVCSSAVRRKAWVIFYFLGEPTGTDQGALIFK